MALRPSPDLRSLPRVPLLRALLGAAALTLGALGALGCGEATPQAKTADSAVDPAEQAKINEGRQKIDAANEAVGEKKYDRARKLLKEAQALGVESQRFEIEEALEKVDKRAAKLWANEVEDKLKEKDCEGAFKDLAKPIQDLDSDSFTRELRKLIGTEAFECVKDLADAKVAAGKFVDARKMVGDATAKAVLGAPAVKKISAEMEGAILESISGRLAGYFKAKRWEKAVEQIDAAEKAGEATPEQVNDLLGKVRAAVAPELGQNATKAIGGRDATATLKQFDNLIKLLRWEMLPADQAEAAGDKAMPQELVRKHDALAVWVEAQRLQMKIGKKAEKRYAHGKVALSPAAASEAPSKRDVVHGGEVWVIGTVKGKALVSTEDPGSGLAAMLDKAVGWAPVDRLVNDATADWLVPDDQLKGERVWGPLRKDEPVYELGVVTEVSGKDISVKRLADDQVVKLTRKQLRSGHLSAGTKVLTFCTAKDQPAKVMEPPTTNSVKLKCDSGEEKEEVLPSLRSKPELLPATK